MIIEKNREFFLVCDMCGQEVGGFDSFDGAVNYKRDSDWESQLFKHGWEDICEECLEN